MVAQSISVAALRRFSKRARRISSGCCLCVLSALLLLTGPTPSRAEPLARSYGTVIFSSNREGDPALYAVNIGGTHLSALTRPSPYQCWKVASPDGSMIAVSRLNDVLLVASNGGKTKIVRRAGVCYDMVWSADGRRLAFDTDRGLFVVDARTARARRLLRGRRIGDVSWSPDGRRLAFAVSPSEEETTGVVAVVDASGRNFARLDVAPRGIISLSWSPDGRWLAVRERKAAPEPYYVLADLVLLSPDGSRKRVTATDVSDERPVVWSPDGHWLTFSTSDDIEVVDAFANDLNPRVVARGVFGSWSPDSTRFAFYGEDGIGISDVDGHELGHLAGDSYADLSWSPDGKRLAFVAEPPLRPAVEIVNAQGGSVAHIEPRASVDGLHWSPDATHLLVDVSTEHFARATNDFYVVRADGTHGHLLTHRGDNQFVAWRAGLVSPRLRTARPLWPTESAVGGGFDARAPINALAADGARVAAVVGDRTGDCSHVTVWSAGAGARRLETSSGDCSDADLIEGSPSATELALAGSRVAWVVLEGCGNTVCGFRMATGTLTVRRIEVIFAADFDKDEPSPSPFHLHGAGNLLVYGAGPGLIRLGTGTSDCLPAAAGEGGGAADCSLINTAEQGGVVDVNGGRVALLADTGALAIVDSSGTTLRKLQFARHEVRGVRLDAGRVVVLRGRRLESYSITTAERTASAPKPHGTFADAAHGIALFTAGRRIDVLRIADRRSWTLTTAGGPVNAQLEPAGLFYSYTTRGRWPGHVRFIPFRLVLAHLR
jgi:Tol biopolymer transport system component